MSLDLEKLEEKLDKALANETKESLINWLNKKRKETKANDGHTVFDRPLQR